jgi:hypothetical protein
MFTYVDDGWRNFDPGYIYLLMFMFTCVDVVFYFNQMRVPFILQTYKSQKTKYNGQKHKNPKNPRFISIVIQILPIICVDF